MVEAMKRSLDRYDVSDDEKRFQVSFEMMKIIARKNNQITSKIIFQQRIVK